MFWPKLVVIKQIVRWGRLAGRYVDRKIGLANTRAAAPVLFLLHYIPSPWLKPPCRYHSYTTTYLLPGWNRRAGIIPTPLHTSSLVGTAVPVPFLLHNISSPWLKPPRRVGTNPTPLYTFSLVGAHQGSRTKF